MKHTPTPWKVGLITKSGDSVYVDVSQDIEEVEVPIAGLLHHDTEANAAFIVKAVNNHYQLLEALEKIVRQTEDMIPPFRAMGADQMMKVARKAIKQAEES